MLINKKILSILLVLFVTNSCFKSGSNLKSEIKRIKKELPFQGSCLVSGEVCDEYYGEYTRLQVIKLCSDTKSRYSVRYCPKKRVFVTCLEPDEYSAIISFYYRDYTNGQNKEEFCETIKDD